MYKMILFDVDGVFLSEERCFDASALSIWELLYAPHFLAAEKDRHTTQPGEEQIRFIRETVFDHDRVLDWMKSKGINSNWDMVFLGFSAQLLQLLKTLVPRHKEKVERFLLEPITEESLRSLAGWGKAEIASFRPSFAAFPQLFKGKQAISKHELLTYFNELASEWFSIPVTQFSRNSSLWELGYSVYQEWYLGAELYRQTEGRDARESGKKGFLYQEIPLAQPEKIRKLLTGLREQGITIGIGTGRSFLETKVPFEQLDLFPLFAENHIATATDVIAAEEAYPEFAPLGKPEPYTYVKAYLGREAEISACLREALPLADGKQILIVGDSVADFLAARKMGCDFAATLTGLTGQAARAKFEELGADFILEDVTCLEKIFANGSV
ncbi:HAD family hydrolase [Thermoactinomyces sp. CICC 10521]|uniref:HAD family hydrolase n=2 Tax=Thermoactinomycetaceae TaxID=186824 RepID=A0A7W1XCQ3_9BACL|nr:HAD family hydrolase [Thermoactinomyces daqus]MBH8602620.1 HAD family hydrolase [Thermoactinomyces sp. CICC 10522]MBH8606268.1 HAD family hydrolase [Thermoactinomyces sp. CICC 10521]